ncbi:MAG TPA: heme NO-binding domain-containing protein [Chthonomonas sp.]|uniref:heme NO-binding domain-containing protein n=1 Tax=Chthonomonas sp. TaxID=2282153 RepID=UPI002B4B44A8|nr:heme NO-binding domain-containing protein [Chthonomonas sp.]HLI48079.1 heme NO-binding domain-containing protein [Chthonomonas sp.]
MKGIVFNLLESVVCSQFGEDTWDDILEESQVHGVYTTLGNYPDDELFQIVCAASKILHISPHEVIRFFGQKSIPLMAAAHPEFFSAHNNTRSFILALNTIIHPEVRKLYPGAQVPVFEFDTSSSNKLIITYSSPRKLCAFAQGLIEGTAEYFGETIDLQHLVCMHRGDSNCVLQVVFNTTSANGKEK